MGPDRPLFTTFPPPARTTAPDDPAEPAALAIARDPLPAPERCCADDACPAYIAVVRWWLYQRGLRDAVAALNDLIGSHDAAEGADCRCANVLKSRSMRAALVALWEDTARLLAAMEVQAEAYFRQQKQQEGG